jgi:rRNA-processing protein FCF1
MRFVVLDTNFLLLLYKAKLNAFVQLYDMVPGEFKIIVSQGIIRELKNSKSPHTKIAVEALNSQIVNGAVEINNDDSFVDDWIVSFCKANENTVVCTNDAELRKRLKKVGAKIISLRTNSHLDYVN